MRVSVRLNRTVWLFVCGTVLEAHYECIYGIKNRDSFLSPVLYFDSRFPEKNNSREGLSLWEAVWLPDTYSTTTKVVCQFPGNTWAAMLSYPKILGFRLPEGWISQEDWNKEFSGRSWSWNVHSKVSKYWIINFLLPFMVKYNSGVKLVTPHRGKGRYMDLT